MAAFTRAWDETAPLGTALLSTLDTIIQQLKADLRERVPPYLALTIGAEADNTIRVTIQAKYLTGNVYDFVETAGASMTLIRVWISDTNYGPATTTQFPVVTVVNATELECPGNYQYLLVGTSAGVSALDINISGAATFYVMAEIDGRVYSSGLVTFA